MFWSMCKRSFNALYLSLQEKSLLCIRGASLGVPCFHSFSLLRQSSVLLPVPVAAPAVLADFCCQTFCHHWARLVPGRNSIPVRLTSSS